MKAVMISIQPKWVEKIVSGEKTIEVRKTAPKLETPFKCYIYETKGKKQYWSQPLPIPYFEGKGKVIGEFICVSINEFSWSNYEAEYRVTHTEERMMCLNQVDLLKYGKGKNLYGWQIANLKIYDKPKELGEFNGYCKYCGMTKECYREDGEFCEYSDEYITVVHHIKCEKVLTRPPQSWCYVEI